MIKINNLSKIFRQKDTQVTALENITLEIEKGDIFGVIGMSGAGKSTLLRCLSGLEKPTGGTVEINGSRVSLQKGAGLGRQMGVVFQGYNLLMQKTVRQNVALPLEIAGRDKETRRQKVESLLKTVGLADKADCYPSQLSGGQKQRVAIARALANDPQILLCDEPTSALDPMTTGQVLDLLKEINSRLSVTVVIITHELGVVKSICNKVAVISNGRIAETGPARQVLGSPGSNATKLLLEWRV